MKDHENIFEYFFVGINGFSRKFYEEEQLVNNPFILAMQTNSFFLLSQVFLLKNCFIVFSVDKKLFFFINVHTWKRG